MFLHPVKKIHMCMVDFLKCLHEEYACKYYKIFQKIQFDDLVKSIMKGHYQMQKIDDLVDLTFPCRRDGQGYGTKDDILSFPVLY